MARESQANRINQLSQVVEQLALHFSTFVALMVPDSEPIQDHIKQLAEIANQIADNQAPRFDFSLSPGEEVPS